MEIKVLIFIAFLVISVISSVVRGMRKFNESRPGSGQPRPVATPKPERSPDPFRDLVKELERSFGEEEKEIVPKPVYTVPEPPEKKYYTAENYERQEKSLEERTAKKKPTILKSEPGQDILSHQKLTEKEQRTPAGTGLPANAEDLRKMVIWSAILNRPQY